MLLYTSDDKLFFNIQYILKSIFSPNKHANDTFDIIIHVMQMKGLIKYYAGQGPLPLATTNT